MHALTQKFHTLIDKIFKRSLRREHSRDVGHDWLMILAGFSILFLVLMSANAYFFYKLDKGDFFTSEQSSTLTAPVFNRSMIKDVNDYYDAREAAFMLY